MARVPKPALSLLAGFVLIVASACSSNAATAGATNQVAGASGAPGSSVAGASGAAFNPNDPSSIIDQVISSGSAIKSFHLKLAVTGTVNASALSSDAGSGAAGAGGVGLSGNIKLDGTALEGDVDVANSAAHLTFNAPSTVMGAPLSGDLILVDNAFYYKVTLLGPMYTKTDLSALSSLASFAPVAIPTPDASAMTGITDEINQLRAAMDQAGVKANLVGVEQIGGQDAYHIALTIPLDQINAEIAAQASAAPGMKIDSASVDFWIYKSNNRLAQFEAKAASSAIGNVDLMLTVSAYDQPVTVTAPPASEVQAAQ